MLIHTTKGLVPFEKLEVHDIVTLEENARVMATEWRLNGEIVRRDVNVNMLRGLEIGLAQESVGG